VRLSRAGRAKLLLGIPRKARNPIRVALAARERVVATVVVRAIYASGTATASRKIKLKR
jgi:hypothetical protein